MIIYYSGEGSRANPEIVFGDRATLMLTYHDMHSNNEPTKRFARIIEEIGKKSRLTNQGMHVSNLYDYESSEMPVGVPKSHFLDSGSFALWSRAETYAKENGCGEWKFYRTPQFYEYLEGYVEFVKKYNTAIHHCANIDVLPFRSGRHPTRAKDTSHALSYRNLKLLEKMGLSPVPVVHYTADLQWLQTYMDEGYDFIGLGGLVGSTSQDGCRYWIDRAFNMVCDTPSREPKVKIHGFGVTSWSLLLRYPWYSVDSTSWTKVSAYGGIFVPMTKGGQFVFDQQPLVIKTSSDAPEAKQHGKHFLTMSPAEQATIKRWLQMVDTPVGKNDEDGNVEEFGVINRYTERRYVNMRYSEEMTSVLSKKSITFDNPRPEGFGLI